MVVFVVALVALTSLQSLSAQASTRIELPSGMIVIHHDNSISHTAQVRLLVRSAPLIEGSRLGSGVSNLLRVVLAERWRGLQGDRLGPLTSTMSWDMAQFNVTTADSQILPAVQALAELINPQEWQEDALVRAREQVLTDLSLRSRRLHYLEQDSLLRLALLRHPARLPTAGRAEQVAGLTAADVQSWHNLTYRAPLMTLVVVGNCDIQALYQQISTSFAPFVGGGWSTPALPGEPEQLASRHREVPVSIGLDRDRYIFAWRLPSMSRREFPSLLLAAEALDAATGPLRQRLAGEQLATDLSVSIVSPPMAPAYLVIAFTPFPERAGLARSVLQEVLSDMAQNADAQLIERAQNKLRRGYLHRDATTQGKIDLLTQAESMTLTPDFYFFRLLPQVQAASAFDLRDAVKLWLRPDGSNRVSLVLRSVPQEQQNSMENDQENVTAGIEVAPVAGDVPPEITPADNGLRMLSQRLPLGIVEVGLHLGGGEGVVDDAIAGAAGVLAKVLERGTGALAGDDLAAYLDDHGMELRVTAGYHSLDLRITCFPEDALAAARLLVGIVSAPAYTEDDVLLAVQRAQAALAMPEEDRNWSDILREDVTQRAFTETPFGRNLLGTKRGLQNVTKAIVDELKARLLVTGNTVVTLNGTYDRDGLPKQVWEMLQEADIPAGIQQQPAFAPWPEEQVAGIYQRKWQHNESGTAVVVRAPDAATVGPDGPAFDLLLTLLVGADGRGGRLGSLLADQKFNGVRGPFVRRIASPGRGIATFLFHGPPETLAKIDEIVRQAILQLNADLLKDGGLNAQELQQGRSACIASRNRDDDRRLMTLDDDVEALLFGYLDSIGNVAYKQAVSATSIEDLCRVCERYLMRQVFTVVLARQAAAQADDQVVEPVIVPVVEDQEPAQLPVAPPVVTPPVQENPEAPTDVAGEDQGAAEEGADANKASADVSEDAASEDAATQKNASPATPTAGKDPQQQPKEATVPPGADEESSSGAHNAAVHADQKLNGESNEKEQEMAPPQEVTP
jgi:predicted Zn-dependent peptidase